MPPLDLRKVFILQSIVNDYVTTSRPVGSERLIEVYKIGCKSATVRNEMAEMAEMGYLTQPHTSAGRIPTDLGYRYYVDELMDETSALSEDEVRQAELSSGQMQNEIEDIILQTCRILSYITSYPSIATDPSTGATALRHVYLTIASPRHVLLVLLLSTGHVEHRLIELENAPAENVLLKLSNYVNTVAGGLDLDEVIRAVQNREPALELAPYNAILSKIFSTLIQVAQSLSERRVYLEGATHILRQPEFQDVQRLESLLNALEQRSALYQVLSRALRGYSATILIGAESGWEPIKECSVITQPYQIGTRTAGYLGVVGPTRMQYDRAAAAVNLMARSLSDMLTNLSLA